jgi:hypothetical protein
MAADEGSFSSGSLNVSSSSLGLAAEGSELSILQPAWPGSLSQHVYHDEPAAAEGAAPHERTSGLPACCCDSDLRPAICENEDEVPPLVKAVELALLRLVHNWLVCQQFLC